MNVWLIVSIISLVVCTAVFTVQIIQIVKFMINCSREGVKAVKFSFNVASVFVIAITLLLRVHRQNDRRTADRV